MTALGSDPVNPPDAIVGLVSGPSVNFWFMHSLLALFRADGQNRFADSWTLVYGPYIHQNRNQLQQQFMDLDRDWLFMVDNDMVFTPEDVWELFAAADEHGPGIYSAPYMIEDGCFVCGPWDEKVPMVYHPMLQLPDRPRRVGVIGSGFTLIHRDVFEAVGEDAFHPVKINAGEDVSLCWRAREKGYVPLLIPKCNPGHHKTVVLFAHGNVRNLVGEEVNLEIAEEVKI